ncbi:MAG TPA: hypothetical protein VF247_11455 [Candidatus Krumholzibacteria bacterium]
MLSTKKGIVLALLLASSQAGSALAEPSYLIYPANVPTVFRYDVGRYDAIEQGQEKFDPSYAIGNVMLWDRVAQRVPVEIYSAPQLVGLEPVSGTSEFVIYVDEFDVIVDGFGTEPRTIGNLCLRFWPYNVMGSAVLTINGVPTNNLVVPLPSMDATTPSGDGFFVGTSLHHVSFIGASAMEIVAFSDKDGDGGYQGTPAYRIVARHSPVATEATSWGKVKALYR